MGEIALQQQRGGDPWKPTLVILLLVVIVLLGSIVYKEYFEGKKFFNEQPEQVITGQTETVISVEDRMISWQKEVEANQVMETYLALPPIIIQGILDRAGSLATPKEIVMMYNSNKEYWISTQLSEGLNLKPTGPDADKIEKVEIKTTLKEPDVKTISPTPGDSVRK